MTTFTWENVLSAIREGNQTIPTAPNGIPVVAVNAPFYELMQLMEALTTGYNALVLRAAEDQKRIERIRKLAEAHFPASRQAAAVPAADGWISVDDMLPPESGEYFTYGSNCGVYPISYSARHKLWNAHDHNTPEGAAKYAISGITHWYPRPVAPAVPAAKGKEDD